MYVIKELFRKNNDIYIYIYIYILMGMIDILLSNSQSPKL